MTESNIERESASEGGSDNGKELPAVIESRVSRISRIIGALSEFEQEELSSEIQALKVRRAHARLANTRNLIIFSVHSALVAGVSAGLLIGALMMSVAIALGGDFIALGTIIQMSIAFAGSIALFSAVYMFLLLKAATTSMARELSLKHSKLYKMRKVEIPVPLKEGIELSITALASKKGWHLESINRDEGTVISQTSASSRSPGELVGMKVDPLTENSCVVNIYSKPMYTALDFGKSLYNVNLLAKEIEEAGVVHQLLKMQ
jgi:hypothetical protein